MSEHPPPPLSPYSVLKDHNQTEPKRITRSLVGQTPEHPNPVNYCKDNVLRWLTQCSNVYRWVRHGHNTVTCSGGRMGRIMDLMLTWNVLILKDLRVSCTRVVHAARWPGPSAQRKTRAYP